MKKLLYIFIFFSYCVLGNSINSFAKEFENEAEVSTQNRTDRYIRSVYEKIKFNKVNKISFQAFKYGFYGYLNMLEAGKLNSSSLLTICDFTLSSNTKRMWVIDLRNKKVLFNTLVAHGMRSGEEFATEFSNTEDSHQSSLGFYTTAETYEGNNGYSLKLNGVDGIFNSNAYERAIVIHGAEYVCDAFACTNKRIGRSHGCPALPVEIASKVIDKIKNGSCLFIYSNSKEYLTSSYWLKNKIKQLPQEADQFELQGSEINNPRYLASKSTMKECDIDESHLADSKQTNHKDLSKSATAIQNENRVISSIVVINEGRNGVSDTVIVK